MSDEFKVREAKKNSVPLLGYGKRPAGLTSSCEESLSTVKMP
jgi:hypothetical protein